MRILLIEPGYRNKYPPLGLMKLSTFHKGRGDHVVFVKGLNPELRAKEWDRAYISTLFTFYWNTLIKTVMYYRKSVPSPSSIFLGGVVASLMPAALRNETGATVVPGLLDSEGKLGLRGDNNIDCLTPDYSIIDPATNKYLDYSYPTRDAYIGYSTRGCIRRCRFCAVRHIEPEFKNGISVAEEIKAIREKYGERKDLLLLDNNVLASRDFARIIEEIIDSGFARDAKLIREKNGRKIPYCRSVDFNQGVDVRLLTPNKMKLLASIAISPLRIAFDNIALKPLYISKVRLAAEFGIRFLSNYILFNYTDTPGDFHERLKVNVELNEEFRRRGLDTHIWSFPMRYAPIFGDHSKDRKFVGRHWNRQYLRGVQCILLATQGVVGRKKDFFEKAFGRNPQEFKQILMRPEDYIIHRLKHEQNGDVRKLADRIRLLDSKEKQLYLHAVTTRQANAFVPAATTSNLARILGLYGLRPPKK